MRSTSVRRTSPSRLTLRCDRRTAQRGSWMRITLPAGISGHTWSPRWYLSSRSTRSSVVTARATSSRGRFRPWRTGGRTGPPAREPRGRHGPEAGRALAASACRHAPGVRQPGRLGQPASSPGRTGATSEMCGLDGRADSAFTAPLRVSRPTPRPRVRPARCGGSGAAPRRASPGASSAPGALPRPRTSGPRSDTAPSLPSASRSFGSSYTLPSTLYDRSGAESVTEEGPCVTSASAHRSMW
jgi:hypothetical protein